MKISDVYTTDWMEIPILSVGTIAELAGCSTAYIRQEIIAGRFPKPLQGEGKLRRWSINQYVVWRNR